MSVRETEVTSQRLETLGVVRNQLYQSLGAQNSSGCIDPRSRSYLPLGGGLRQDQGSVKVPALS